MKGKTKNKKEDKIMLELLYLLMPIGCLGVPTIILTIVEIKDEIERHKKENRSA